MVNIGGKRVNAKLKKKKEKKAVLERNFYLDFENKSEI